MPLGDCGEVLGTGVKRVNAISTQPGGGEGANGNKQPSSSVSGFRWTGCRQCCCYVRRSPSTLIGQSAVWEHPRHQRTPVPLSFLSPHRSLTIPRFREVASAGPGGQGLGKSPLSKELGYITFLCKTILISSFMQFIFAICKVFLYGLYDDSLVINS